MRGRSSKKPCLMWHCWKRSPPVGSSIVTASTSTGLCHTSSRGATSLPARTSPPSWRAGVLPCTRRFIVLTLLHPHSRTGSDEGSDHHLLVCSALVHKSPSGTCHPLNCSSWFGHDQLQSPTVSTMTEPHTRAKRHPKYQTAYRVNNGRAYDKALRERGDSTLWIS